MTVSTLTPNLKTQYEIADGVRGVVVTAVSPRSKAGEIRLPPGAVITRAFSRPVTTPAELKAAIDAARAAGRPSVLLSIEINGSTVLVALELSKAE
jgi:serine protease Do